VAHLNDPVPNRMVLAGHESNRPCGAFRLTH
jgi:hypothetical protein